MVSGADCRGCRKRSYRRLTALLAVACIIAGIMLESGYAIVASIGNPRMIIHTNISSGPVTIKRPLIVNNQNEFAVDVTLQVKDIEDIVQLNKSVLFLEPDSSERVDMTMTIQEPGFYEGSVLVSFTKSRTLLDNQPLLPGDQAGLAATIIIDAAGEAGGSDSSNEGNSEAGGIGSGSESGDNENPGGETSEATQPEASHTSRTQEGQNNRSSTSDRATAGARPNPVIGITITASIVALGVVVYTALSRGAKTTKDKGKNRGRKR